MLNVVKPEEVEKKYQRTDECLRKTRILAFEILGILFKVVKTAPENFFRKRYKYILEDGEKSNDSDDEDQDEAFLFVIAFMKSFHKKMDEDEKDPYKNNFPVFLAFLEMLQNFQDDGDLYALLFKKCKLVQLLSPLLLDSDKLDTGLAKNKNDKLNIMQKLF